ncbi:MAG: response regulator transcription factor [Chitinophagaceae bacterium]
MPIKVMIADDHAIFRDGFKLLLKDQRDALLVGEAASGRELIQRVEELHPNIVITDIKMPGTDGIELCRQLRTHYPGVDVIALSMFSDDHLIADMLEAGAKGYLLKNTNRSELLQAIRTVYDGGTYYSPATSEKLARLIGKNKFQLPKKQLEVRLSAREKEILQLICEQYTTREIAGALNLSIRTIESYRLSLHEKTRSRNSIGVAIYAIRNGLFPLNE